MEADRHSGALRALYPFLKGFACFLFLFFAAPIRSINRRSVPKDGAVLVIANHISNTDPVVVQYACPRFLHFLARKELFDMGLLGRFIKWWRAIPIKQSSADKGAIKRSIELLKSGEAVAIFPEGQLSPDGKLLELFAGTALIIRKAESPCICLGITGSNKMMPHPKETPTWAFTTIKANWGDARKFDPETPDEEIMAWIEAELRRLTGQD